MDSTTNAAEEDAEEIIEQFQNAGGRLDPIQMESKSHDVLDHNGNIVSLVSDDGTANPEWMTRPWTFTELTALRKAIEVSALKGEFDMTLVKFMIPNRTEEEIDAMRRSSIYFEYLKEAMKATLDRSLRIQELAIKQPSPRTEIMKQNIQLIKEQLSSLRKRAVENAKIIGV